jgi:hypothetical protein
MLEQLPTEIPQMALSHGQARWVLMHTGPRMGSEETLDAYLKFLRRNGVPFPADQLDRGRGVNVSYSYDHLMELALALFMRSQDILKGDVVALLSEQRAQFREIFHRASAAFIWTSACLTYSPECLRHSSRS